MRKWSFLTGMFGLPVLLVLVVIGYLTPSYVPSRSLKSAAASTTSIDVAQRRIIASFVGRCRWGLALNQQLLNRDLTLYSWENDTGILARTVIACMPGKACSVTAQALLAHASFSRADGSRQPVRIAGCGRATPDWLNDAAE